LQAGAVVMMPVGSVRLGKPPIPVELGREEEFLPLIVGEFLPNKLASEFLAGSSNRKSKKAFGSLLVQFICRLEKYKQLC
jgi:hypothetical protein